MSSTINQNSKFSSSAYSLQRFYCYYPIKCQCCAYIEVLPSVALIRCPFYIGATLAFNGLNSTYRYFLLNILSQSTISQCSKLKSCKKLVKLDHPDEVFIIIILFYQIFRFKTSHPKMFLKISQNSQENTATLLKKRFHHRYFLVNFVKFLITHLLQKTSGDWFCGLSSMLRIFTNSYINGVYVNYPHSFNFESFFM